MGLFPESLGGLRGLSVLLRCVLLVVKSSSKKVQITSLMHIAVAPSDADPRSCLTLRRVRLATLLRKASFGRLHIIWLNGSSTTTASATAANAGTTTMTTCNKNVASFALTRKKFSYVCGSGGGEKEQGKNVVGVFFILRCVQICSLLQHCCMGMETAVPSARLRSHSFIHSFTHS